MLPQMRLRSRSSRRSGKHSRRAFRHFQSRHFSGTWSTFQSDFASLPAERVSVCSCGGVAGLSRRHLATQHAIELYVADQAFHALLNKSVVSIQSAGRGLSVRSRLRAEHAAAATVQRRWRGHTGRMQADSKMQRELDRLDGVLVIQRAWRCGLARRAVARAAVAELAGTQVIVQACIAMRRNDSRQVSFKAAGPSQLLLVLLRSSQAAFAVVEAACIAVQTRWRGYMQRQRFIASVAALFEHHMAVIELVRLHAQLRPRSWRLRQPHSQLSTQNRYTLKFKTGC